MFDCMEHISGAHLRRDDLDISPAALTVARSCNVGFDAAVKQLEAGAMGIKGGRISPEIRARLSPLVFEHINFHGFYPFHRPDLGEGLRDLRAAAADQEED
jgi:hypothetical protein